MAPIGFLEFRDKLNPASGFQSMQFRELEFVSGAKDEKILATFKNDAFAYERLSRRFGERTLADSFWGLASRHIHWNHSLSLVQGQLRQFDIIASPLFRDSLSTGTTGFPLFRDN